MIILGHSKTVSTTYNSASVSKGINRDLTPFSTGHQGCAICARSCGGSSGRREEVSLESKRHDGGYEMVEILTR